MKSEAVPHVNPICDALLTGRSGPVRPHPEHNQANSTLGALSFRGGLVQEPVLTDNAASPRPETKRSSGIEDGSYV